MILIEELHEFVQPDAISGLHPTPARVPYFVLGVSRQSTNSVDELFSPYQVRGRMMQPSDLLRSFDDLHCDVCFSITMRMMTVIVKYLKRNYILLYHSDKCRSLFRFIHVKWGFGLWTKRLGIFVNTAKH